MTERRHSEAAFETVIEQHLIGAGYVSVSRDLYDRKKAVFPSVVLEFIKETQPSEWSKLEALHGDRTGEQVITDLCKWMDAHGALATVRHGFKCYGPKLHVAFFEAAHRLNPELEASYAANRLGITRQLHFSNRSEKSLDVVLSLNGVPLITLGIEHMDELFRSMAKRGRQANLSFFAFTATPKHKTLAVFGRDGEASHRYMVRQAIEEGFILDVLRNYTTYATYFRLLKASADDPEVERKKAAKALARFMRLHPHNIAQKTEVMVEHFHAVTRHKIGGRAKAMVVTGSRPEAVRYKQSFDRYIRQQGYAIKTLVAFSGTVVDDKEQSLTYTEEGMHLGVREKELPEKFATPEYQVLLVAEKYQTGFDQPLLHTMYVDKRLAGIQAVQTLSRLNRIHPLKEDTFVLDFVNDREEIREAFKTFYEGAIMGDEVDPARMYQINAELDASGIYLDEECERFCKVYFKPKQRQSASDHQGMNAALDPAVSRFSVLQRDEEEEAEEWRGKLHAFCNLYAFLSQVIP